MSLFTVATALFLIGGWLQAKQPTLKNTAGLKTRHHSENGTGLKTRHYKSESKDGEMNSQPQSRAPASETGHYQCSAGSAEASSVAHHSLRKGDYLGLSELLPGEGAAFLPAGGQAAGAISVLFAVDPLEQDIKHEVAAKNAKRQEHCDGHVGLPRTDTDGFQGQGKSRGGSARKSGGVHEEFLKTFRRKTACAEQCGGDCAGCGVWVGDSSEKYCEL